MKQLRVQLPDGSVHSGFYAIRKLLPYSRLRWITPLLYVPPVPFLGVRLYRWVAKNRHRFPGREDRSL